MKIRELIALLATADLDAQIVVATSPDDCGFVSDPLPFLGQVRASEGKLVVLGSRESVSDCCKLPNNEFDELTIDWPRRPV